MELLETNAGRDIQAQLASALVLHRDEPGVREALEKAVQANRFGYLGREIARALRGPAVPTAPPGPPR
jgi:hypothetical protein